MADARYEINHDGQIVQHESALCADQGKVISDLFSQFGWSCEETDKNGASRQLLLSDKNGSTKNITVFSGTIRNESRNAYEKKIQLGTTVDPRTKTKESTIVLGIYVFEANDSYKDAIYVGYPIDDNIRYNTNPSLRGVFINKLLIDAKNDGFVYDKEHNTVGFRAEFVFYYLKHFYDIHYNREQFPQVSNGLDPNEQKEKFRAWMGLQSKSNGGSYSENTINSYIRCMEKGYNEFEKFNDYDSIFRIQDVNSVNKYIEYLDNEPSFKEFDDKTDSNTCSCGLKKYMEFLREGIDLYGKGWDKIESSDLLLREDGSLYGTPITVALKNCTDIQREPRTVRIHPINCIIYGAPGTGKTYSTAEYALAIIDNREVDLKEKTADERKETMSQYKEYINNGQVVFTTFHQSYGYEDFIQGLRPDTTTDKMAFRTVDGVLKQIADKAMNDDQNNYVIIIDEINRANISKVFGELITLIEDDKRWGEINEACATLQSGDIFAVPNNLYIVGTMNSADKSISLIDTALRRRFEFIEQKPDASLVKNDTLKSVFERLNSKLVGELDSTDLLIGHSYFLNKNEDDLCKILNNSIIPLLYEYFYDNRKKVASILNEAIKGLGLQLVDDKVGRLSVKKQG